MTAQQPTSNNSEQPKKNGVRIRTDRAAVSPYIIHLSRQDQPAEDVAPHLDALAQQLTVDADEDELSEASDDLSIDFNDLAKQLREPDLQSMPTALPDSRAAESNFETDIAFIDLETPAAGNVNDLVAIEEVEEQPEVVVTAEETDEDDEIVLRVSLRERLSNAFTIPAFSGPKTRAMAAFVALSLIIVLPIHAIQQVSAAKLTQAEITDAGKNAIDNFLRGAQALENDRFDVAGIDFQRATSDFEDAETSLKSFDAVLTAVANTLPQTDKTYDSVKGLITAGKELSLAATSLTSGADEISQRTSITATTKLELLNSYVTNALPHIELASTALEKVKPSALPAEYQDTVASLKDRIPQLASSMKEFTTFSDTLTTVLGGQRKMRYLVIFQNNTELRATGGFPGSFAEIDVQNGEIVNINIPGGGTYDLQGQLSEFVEAPQPLSLINPRWEFHDSNWFPDFPTSAKKMLWFYEHAGGPTVDGVIAINATMMPKLLEITGPIDMPEYGRTIDSENFLFETQKIVELEYDQFANPDSTREEAAPKQFIGDLAPKILEHLTDADMPTMLAMLNLLGEGLNEKDVQLYFEDNALQSNIQKLGWSGELKQTDGDYLMVVNTNLGGGKTDTVIDQNVDIESTVSEDGSIINTVTVTKEHRGIKTDLFDGVNNVDYIRLYVPKDSELLSASGFEIPPAELFEASDVPLNPDEDLALLETERTKDAATGTDIWIEDGKTVFGNWMQTKPGETQVVTFTYRLPIALESGVRDTSFLEQVKSHLGFKNLETHTIFVQKQPGVVNRTTNYSVHFPDQKTVLWGSEGGATDTGNIEFTNDQDHFIRFLLENDVN